LNYTCKRCGKVTQTEKLMIVHLTWKHRIQLPIGLHPDLFDGGLEKIKEQIKKQLDELEKKNLMN